MKRFFFLSIALAAVAVGCTKSGLLESPQTYETPITFEPYTGKAPETKATVATIETLYDGFRVIGYVQTAENTNVADAAWAETPFLDREVSATIGTDGQPVWGYENAMYWPENKFLTFVAYGLNVNEDEDDPIFAQSTDYKTYTYEVPELVADQKDLVISPVMANNNDKSGTIVVTMYHVLSRVGFKVKPEGTAGVNVVIKDVKLTGTFQTSATFDLTNAVVPGTSVVYNKEADDADGSISYSLFNGGYSLDATAKSTYPGFVTTSTSTATAVQVWNNYSFASGKEFDPSDVEDDDIDEESDEDFYMMIMPQTAPADAKVEVIYQLSDAVEQKVEIPLPADFSFDAGKAYEFVFTISTVAVGFDVDVDNWLPEDGPQSIDGPLS